jgi:hypothetical protein
VRLEALLSSTRSLLIASYFYFYFCQIQIFHHTRMIFKGILMEELRDLAKSHYYMIPAIAIPNVTSRDRVILP